MSKTDDEKRGYARGYAAGSKVKAEAEARHQREIKAVAVRAERAEAAAGIGHCINCAHWDPPEHCTWGYCNAGKQPGSPWGCWAQVNRADGDSRPATSPHFGCVLFLPKDGTAGVQAARKPQEWTDPEKEPRFQPGEET